MNKNLRPKESASPESVNLKLQSHAFRKRLIDAGLIATDWLGRIPHPNGKDLKITMGEVWELHQRDHLPRGCLLIESSLHSAD